MLEARLFANNILLHMQKIANALTWNWIDMVPVF